MKKNVWFISKYVVAPFEDKPGNRSFELLKEISNLGYDVTIITSDANHFSYEPAFAGKHKVRSFDALKVYWLKTIKYDAPFSFRRVVSWIHFEWQLFWLNKKKLSKPEIIIISSLSLFTIINGIFFKRKFKAKLIFEIRDIWPLTLTEEGGFSRRNPLIKFLSFIEKLGYLKADTIVGTMPNLGEHVTKILGYNKPTFCIPMGLEKNYIKRNTQVPNDFVEKYIQSNKFIVAYAGSIGVSNAMDQLFVCADNLSNNTTIQFLIIGDGYLKKHFVEKYGHLPNIVFTGTIPKEMVISALSYCDLLYFSVHPSKVWDYGLSLNKLIDYMLAAKPIVASYSGYPSMLNEADCGTFIPAEDTAALKNAILRYAATSSEELKEIGQRGKSWLLENRSYEKLAKEYIQYF